MPGHFPGQPVVAGVILLQLVAAALRDERGLSLTAVVEAKFLAPLLPGQDARLTLSDTGPGRYKFDIRRGDTLLAKGIVEGNPRQGAA
jgi:3-hydroxymyristoyl/3-hydroxydecanoyl-(acyl carrier protein) dehydratase